MLRKTYVSGEMLGSRAVGMDCCSCCSDYRSDHCCCKRCIRSLDRTNYIQLFSPGRDDLVPIGNRRLGPPAKRLHTDYWRTSHASASRVNAGAEEICRGYDRALDKYRSSSATNGPRPQCDFFAAVPDITQLTYVDSSESQDHVHTVHSYSCDVVYLLTDVPHQDPRALSLV